ncbi:MAG: Bug family tripartite tricarboxylate transporter substrate binding protein [Pseudolabrys sp.]
MARRAATALFILFSLLLPLAASAQAQNWPSRPIRIVVAFGAGGTADIVARLLADKLSPVLGQPVVVENRPGAGGNVGASAVAHSDPDGYSFLMSGSPTHSVGPHLFKNLNYDPMRDVPPVAMIAIAPNLLVVNASLPVKSLDDLVRLAREKPGQLTYSSAGIGTSGHLAAEMLKQAAGVDMRHVPYKSGPEAVTGVISGDVSFVFFTVPSVLPQVESGKLRALAITSMKRSAVAPNIPTVAELGYPGFEALAWFALFAPRGTPQTIIDKLDIEIGKILQQPDVRKKMVELGMEAHFLDARQLADYVSVESPKWGKLLQGMNAQAK